MVADGKVFLAGADTHSVCALDAAEAEQALEPYGWSTCTLASHVSQRTGLVWVGRRVYRVRASDGALAWRFQASPDYAGLYPHLTSSSRPGPCRACSCRTKPAGLRPGGRLISMAAYTFSPWNRRAGKVLHEKTIYSPDPETGKMIPEIEAQQMAGVLNDIPGSDGTNVFLRQMNVSSDLPGDGSKHLFTTAGYLDSTRFNRTYWRAGRAQTTGPMVLGDGVAFGVEPFTSRSRDVLFLPGTHPYSLRCLSINPPKVAKVDRKGKKVQGEGNVKPTWEQRLPLRSTAWSGQGTRSSSLAHRML